MFNYLCTLNRNKSASKMQNLYLLLSLTCKLLFMVLSQISDKNDIIVVCNNH